MHKVVIRMVTNAKRKTITSDFSFFVNMRPVETKTDGTSYWTAQREIIVGVRFIRVREIAVLGKSETTGTDLNRRSINIYLVFWKRWKSSKKVGVTKKLSVMYVNDGRMNLSSPETRQIKQKTELWNFFMQNIYLNKVGVAAIHYSP